MQLPQAGEYLSCEWIEGGIAFNRRSLHSCLIVHHRTGFPFISDYNGGPLPLEKILEARERIRAGNRNGGHPECAGCAHLKKKDWGASKHAITIVGIAHYSACNIKCNYCFLQTQDPASFAAGYSAYPLVPVIRDLISSGSLAPDAIIDWGGGEPTIYKEFDELMDMLLAHGTTHYIHSNGVKLPESLRRADPTRIHIICSVDAGRPETYLQMKQRDHLERVWTNLAEYIRRGVKVTLKYIMKEENSSDADLEPFVARAVSIGGSEVLIDIDYDFPIPSPQVIRGLGRLKHLALRSGLYARFGFTGNNFAAENNVAGQIDAAFNEEQVRHLSRLMTERNYGRGDSASVMAEQYIRMLEEHCREKDAALLSRDRPAAALKSLALSALRVVGFRPPQPQGPP